MKSIFSLTGLLVVLLAFCLVEVGIAQPKSQAPQPIPDQYIVILKESAAKPVVKQQKKNNDREQKAAQNKEVREKNVAKVKDVHKKKGIQESSVIEYYADALVGFTGKMSKEKADELAKDPDVESVVQDQTVALGPIQPESTSNPPDMTAQGYVTCAVAVAGGPLDGSMKGTWLWICDTGINLTHPDLNVQTNPTYAKSFITGQTVEDGHGHGTHCAGIAAAKNNAIGPTGVSAGAKVVPVKVLNNSGSGSFSGILAGINHIAIYDIPGDVVSMSIGGYPVSNCINQYLTLKNAIINLGNAGTSVVIAAGNDYDCTGATKSLPGCYNGNRVYTVGALNCNKTCANFSNWGSTVVDWAAVGVGVYSTYKNGGYATMSGTSMATPVVAGIIHSKNGAPPVSGGIVNCCNYGYRIARR